MEIPLDLASSRKRAAHSRTWEIEPAEDSISGRVMVWMESITTSVGLTLWMCENTNARFVSVTKYKFLGRAASPAAFFTARRLARIFTWRSDSSPET